MSNNTDEFENNQQHNSSGNPETNALVKAIEQGTATTEQVGAALQVIQVGLSKQLIDGAGIAAQPLQRLQALQDRLVQVVETQLSAALDINSIELPQAIEMLVKLQDQSIKVLELQRKIVQGRELIPPSTLTEDEKKVVKLFNSFPDKQSKKLFLQLVDQELAKLEAEDE